MDEREVVDDFDGRAHVEQAAMGVPDCLGHEPRQGGAHALAASLDQVHHGLTQAWMTGGGQTGCDAGFDQRQHFQHRGAKVRSDCAGQHVTDVPKVVDVLVEEGLMVFLGFRIPPRIVHQTCCDAAEPWRNGVFWILFNQHGFHVVLTDPTDLGHLVGIWAHFEIFDPAHQQVVDLAFNPCLVLSRLVPETTDIGQVVHRHRFNPQLLLQFSNGGPSNAQPVRLFAFFGDIERMRATGVGPDPREGDLVVGTALQQQPAVLVEQHHGKRPVVGPRTTVSVDLGGPPKRAVHLVHEDDGFCHHVDLLRVKTVECLGVGISDIGPHGGSHG